MACEETPIESETPALATLPRTPLAELTPPEATEAAIAPRGSTRLSIERLLGAHTTLGRAITRFAAIALTLSTTPPTQSGGIKRERRPSTPTRPREPTPRILLLICKNYPNLGLTRSVLARRPSRILILS